MKRIQNVKVSDLWINISFLFCCFQPGRLKQVQGMGWWLDEENIAQLSLNLLDHEITPMHVAYEETCKDAKVSTLSCQCFPSSLGLLFIFYDLSSFKYFHSILPTHSLPRCTILFLIFPSVLSPVLHFMFPFHCFHSFFSSYHYSVMYSILHYSPTLTIWTWIILIFFFWSQKLDGVNELTCPRLRSCHHFVIYLIHNST